ncbi:MAG: addiction module protein [Pyrinomonadaceae bacterium]
MSVLLDEILELPVAERIKLVGDIWDSIADVPDAVEITVEQKAELDRRMDDYRRNPENTIPWKTIKAEALDRK